jgi:hypothetical protein
VTLGQRARWILISFLFTFVAARVTVFLIATGRIPEIYLRFRGTHVHHFDLGIFILSGVGAYLLLGSPRETGWRRAALLYGIGLALTFDEFGMWLHLGGSYWQRSSFDAIGLITAFFSLAFLQKSDKTWFRS